MENLFVKNNDIFKKGCEIMKKLYTIGETSKLLGVTTQTLRHYDKIKLVEPTYIDEETGYRYYTFDKFHYIDRIKYLQSFGMDLEEIKKVIHSGNVDSLLHFLDLQSEKKKKELKKLEDMLKDMEWYRDYFTYFRDEHIQESIYKIHLPNRYILKVPCYDEELYDMEIRLAEKKSSLKNKEIVYRRQYGYKIDYQHLCNKVFRPTDYFVYLREKPTENMEYYEVLPAGEYLCTNMKILTNLWDPKNIQDYFENKNVPLIVLAMEYEDNLVEYNQANYEIQFYLGT